MAKQEKTPETETADDLSEDQIMEAMEDIAGQDLQEQAPDKAKPDEDGKDGETTDEANADEDNPDKDTEEAELIKWGEGDDAKEATMDELIEAFEQSKNPPDFTTNLEYQQTLNQMGDAARNYQNGFQQLSDYATQLQHGYTVVLNALHPGEAPNPAGLSTEDYNLLKHDWETKNAEYANVYNQAQTALGQVGEQAQTARQQVLQAELQALSAKWPEWSDTKVQQDAYGVLAEFGFTPPELQQFTDHRLHLVLKELMELRAGKEAGGKAVKAIKAKNAPKRVKARVSNAKSGNTALAKLQGKVKSGKALNPDEAALLMMDI